MFVTPYVWERGARRWEVLAIVGFLLESVCACCEEKECVRSEISDGNID